MIPTASMGMSRLMAAAENPKTYCRVEVELMSLVDPTTHTMRSGPEKAISLILMNWVQYCRLSVLFPVFHQDDLIPSWPFLKKNNYKHCLKNYKHCLKIGD